MQSNTTIQVKSTHHNKPIITDVYFEKNNTKKQLVIFCHGYKGYKDWGAWNLMVPEFVKCNLFFVKFNFSHNGTTLEQPSDFADLEAYGQNNYTKELQDLDAILLQHVVQRLLIGGDRGIAADVERRAS